jgi:hypothetical protein
VLWIAHTHVIAALDFTPRLALLSPVKQCAKTRVLELVARLARRARHSVSMSAAFMFRVIEDQAPTLLIDEVDTIFGKRAKDEAGEALRGLIDAGFERGATVGRMVGEGAGMQPKDFPVFCPVALAGIGDCLPDTITDRSIVVRMRRRAPGETVEAFRRRRAGAQAEALRRRLGSWAETAEFTVEATVDADPELPDGVEDRAADCWEPIIAVAEAAGGMWPGRARDACKVLTGERANGNQGTGARLLADVRTVLAGENEIFSAVLVERLNALDEAPWGGWRQGKGIQARDVAGMLGVFGIRSKNVRIGDQQKKGYEAADFDDAFTRYLPPPSDDRDTLGNSVPTSPNGDEPPATPSEQAKHAEATGTDASSQTGQGRNDGPSPEREELDWA